MYITEYKAFTHFIVNPSQSPLSKGKGLICFVAEFCNTLPTTVFRLLY